jgi:hypothetical protein
MIWLTAPNFAISPSYLTVVTSVVSFSMSSFFFGEDRMKRRQGKSSLWISNCSRSCVALSATMAKSSLPRLREEDSLVQTQLVPPHEVRQTVQVAKRRHWSLPNAPRVARRGK